MRSAIENGKATIKGRNLWIDSRPAREPYEGGGWTLAEIRADMAQHSRSEKVNDVPPQHELVLLGAVVIGGRIVGTLEAEFGTEESSGSSPVSPSSGGLVSLTYGMIGSIIAAMGGAVILVSRIRVVKRA